MTAWKRSKSVGVTLAISAALACGGGSNPNTPSPATMAGEWTGTATRANGAVFNLTWTATNNGGELGGTVTISQGGLVNSGTGEGKFGGNDSGMRVAIFLRASGAPPPGRDFGCRVEITSSPGPTSGLPATTSQMQGTADLQLTSCDQFGLANTIEPVQVVLRK